MTPKNNDAYREVYSTDKGALCPECGRGETGCICAEQRRLKVRGDGNVKVRRETKGRAGKTVTTVSGLAMNDGELKTLLTDLKRVCGCGGSVKDGVIEIQGDRCDQVIRELDRKGIRSKRAGG